MKKITLLLSAMLFSVMSFASLGEGYTKVTDITTLAAGDKVVLYCDDAALGVTGYNGNKDATVASTGWVEYVVEAANGGVLLKDGKTYPWICIKNEFFPRVFKTRNLVKDGSKYYGPYTDAYAVKETLDFINKKENIILRLLK